MLVGLAFAKDHPKKDPSNMKKQQKKENRATKKREKKSQRIVDDRLRQTNESKRLLIVQYNKRKKEADKLTTKVCELKENDKKEKKTETKQAVADAKVATTTKSPRHQSL